MNLIVKNQKSLNNGGPKMTAISKKIPTSEWLQNKLEKIIEMTEMVSKECPGHIVEPDYGFWSLKKEIALMYWIWPFLHIASKHFKNYYYIDLFAGSGLVKADEVYFVGSPLVAVCSTLPGKKFREFICFEIDESRKKVLENRATKASEIYDTCRPKIFNCDCNKNLQNVLEEFCPSRSSCYLAFIDPQGINLNWSTLHQLLMHGKGDIILNFPTMGILRNINKNESKDTINNFYGDSSWQDINPSADDLIKHYMSKIAGYNKAVDFISVINETNTRLYDIIFITGSKGMKNVLSDLKIRLQRLRTKDFKNTFKTLKDPQQQQLTGYK